MNWKNKDAESYIKHYGKKGFSQDIALRIYSARLLGNNPELVLHGGGNSSVKIKKRDILNREIDVICVKGSGWDMSNIEPEGFPELEIDLLKKAESLDSLSDENMVSLMRRACLDPESPDPSVETLLHAFLPHKYIDHTHSNSILAIANLKGAEDIFKEIFLNKVAILPWIMPGFNLAKACSTIHRKNPNIEGIILLNHGIFSFGETAKQSYERMISLVRSSERFIKKKKKYSSKKLSKRFVENDDLARVTSSIFKVLSKFSKGNSPFVRYVNCDESHLFMDKVKLNKLAGKGVITPDHVIRIKDEFLFLDKFTNDDKWLKKLNSGISQYAKKYSNYFNDNKANKPIQILDQLPRLFFIEKIGLFIAGFSEKELIINQDLALANLKTQINASCLGKFMPLKKEEIFEMEYWSLEQKKLKNSKNKSKTALITGGAGTIGLATALEFKRNGYEVVLLDINKKTEDIASQNGMRGYVCNLLDLNETTMQLNSILKEYGTVSTLVLNSGSAKEGLIFEIDKQDISEGFENNFWAHQNICQEVFKLMKFQETGGSIVFNITKQVLNQGKGFGAYGISKSAMLSLMRQYSIEGGPYGIRSNGVNPDKIQSNLLNNELILKRSKSRALSKEDYLKGNLLNREVLPENVAEAIYFLSEAESTTGALLGVDGGNASAFVR